MKNTLITLVAAGLSALAGINGANAQAQANSDRMERRGNIFETEKIVTPVTDLRAYGDEINPKALKNFSRTYKDVSGERWMKSKDGFSAEFISNEIRNTIFYKNNGEWFGSVKRYAEQKLPHEVRDIVKREYYDYSIFFVEEVETIESAGMPTYIIYLEDKSSFKLVRVFDMEMKVWKEYVKG